MIEQVHVSQDIRYTVTDGGCCYGYVSSSDLDDGTPLQTGDAVEEMKLGRAD